MKIMTHRGRLAPFLLALGAAAFVASAALAQSFDKLDRCGDMAGLIAVAQNGGPRCGVPRSAVAVTIARRIQMPGLCFFSLSAPALAGFECLTSSTSTRRVECIRPLGYDPVAKIKAQYDAGLDQQTANYLRRASQCAYGNGRVSEAAPSVVATSLFGWVARSELAYGAETGPRSHSSGAVVHGYASIDPTAGHLGRWIEFVVAFEGDCRSAECGAVDEEEEEVERSEGWIITRTSPRELVDRFDKLARSAGAPITVDMESYRLSRAGGNSGVSLADLKRLEDEVVVTRLHIRGTTQAWAAQAKHILREEGFRSPTAQELSATGLGGADFSQLALQRIPYAMRMQTVRPTYELVLKETGSGCFRGGRGGIGMGIGWLGDEVLFVSIGAGECQFDAGDYLSKVVEAVTLDGY